MFTRRQMLTTTALACTSSLASAANWPQWRGPAGTGISSEANLPIAWSESGGVRWKQALPGPGASTPAIWDDAVFVTSHTAEGQLLVLRLDKKTGKIVWQTELGTGEASREADKRSTQKFHNLHNLASPSPVTDGQRVVVHFGDGTLAALDFDGKELWRHNLQEAFGPYSIWWGHANSPVLHSGTAISVCMQDSLADLRDKPAESYLVAHDLRDGHVKWKVPRMTGAKAEQGDAYTTPLIVEVNGKPQLITMGGNVLDGRDPASGKELWRMEELFGGRTVTGPTYSHNMIFCTRGQRGPLLAVKLGRSGDLDRRDIAWTYGEGSPDACSPVVWDTLLFTITDDGIVRCFDIFTGNVHWKQRLKGSYKASPLAAEARIFFLNTDGLCTVLGASPRFDKLTENQLDDEFLASPATSDDLLFLRGKQHLYALGR
jgi:outer membrane protein assembly factor BamB